MGGMPVLSLFCPPTRPNFQHTYFGSLISGPTLLLFIRRHRNTVLELYQESLLFGRIPSVSLLHLFLSTLAVIHCGDNVIDFRLLFTAALALRVNA